MDKLDIRQQQQLTQAFERADHIVTKSYLPDLARLEIIPMEDSDKHLPVSETTRLMRIGKVVHDKNENVLDKLSSVYNALAGNKGALIVLVTSDGTKTEFYIGTKSDSTPGSVSSCQKTLEKAFKGNFPGSELNRIRNNQVEELMERVFTSEMESSPLAISAVSGVASLRSEDKADFVQGIEKLIDAMRGDKFSILYVADPVPHGALNEIRRGYENLYTQLSPFAASDLQFSANDSTAVTEGLTQGFSESINQSLSKTQATTENMTTTNNQSTNYARNILTSAFVRVTGGKSSTSDSASSTTGYSTSRTEGETTGTSRMDSSQESSSKSVTEGSSRSLSLKFANKSVQTLLERIEEQLQRLKKSEDLGMWNCAAYFIAEDAQTSKIAANTYKSLMRGDNSSVESACVNTWDNSNKRNLVKVIEYVSKFRHPLIELNGSREEQAAVITPGSLVNGFELAIQVGLPLKSVSGLPVMEAAEFGRNIVTYDSASGGRRISLGHIFHMGAPEETEVTVDVDSLAMHTFVTGSTGSGKSNTLYQLLDKLQKEQVRFLVIEPAKGEYKHVFGGRKDVRVFGTNPAVAELLKINPFVFPDGVHVLEHIDRLVEIFNACWPMYAAMPAVLKEAIERAYLDCGWDLEESVNYNGGKVFPSFLGLMGILPEIIRESEYSQEVKGNYTGALMTRVKSLTNGINGQIFTAQETDNTVLFDQNCIVDLSRVGSSETKALLMGVLVMRLQEHRSVFSNEMNGTLKHVTVIEEAHHLLRRTSQEQSQEGSNLQGKAVEMLSNAIAEMRTYGEGFIIVDQSPSLLDMSVIRNTNTKLILRLPDESDRQLVGKSANLNDEQIVELAKLKVGVSAIYQNNWLQPVLCLVDRFEGGQKYEYRPAAVSDKQLHRRMLGSLTRLLLAARTADAPVIDPAMVDWDPMKRWLLGRKLAPDVTAFLLEDMDRWKQEGRMELWREEQFERLSSTLYALYDGRAILKSARLAEGLPQWNEQAVRSVRTASELFQDEIVENAVLQCLLREQSLENEESKQFYFLWVEHANEGGIA
ncbi:ATP-binding protein [Paenibacillus mendelii]|uniref:ATP-binding protein n=1 Tax=Paenibacillus mendelii TaxID=206163 RepID=A0ABV6JI65_9BACL|nr:DUF87 domain-containing protein [Paenibacillus mendelii]MCQ6558481.1 DUF87 domain-containing protein [Paenibacillus mendelii]